MFARNDIALDDVPLKDLRGGHVSTGNSDRDGQYNQPYKQPQPFQAQPSQPLPPQGGYPSPGESFYNMGLPQEPTGTSSYEWNPNQPNPMNNLNPGVNPSRDMYASSNPGYPQEQQQQQQQYPQDINNLDYYNQPPPSSSSGDTPFQGNPYAQPNYGSSMYGPASGSGGYDMNMGGMNNIDAMP